MRLPVNELENGRVRHRSEIIIADVRADYLEASMKGLASLLQTPVDERLYREFARVAFLHEVGETLWSLLPPYLKEEWRRAANQSGPIWNVRSEATGGESEGPGHWFSPGIMTELFADKFALFINPRRPVLKDALTFGEQNYFERGQRCY